jgi:hypothetical protein
MSRANGDRSGGCPYRHGEPQTKSIDRWGPSATLRMTGKGRLGLQDKNAQDDRRKEIGQPIS